MDLIEQLFVDTFRRQVLPQLGARFVAKRFQESGITLTDEQRSIVEQWLRDSRIGDLARAVKLTERQVGSGDSVTLKIDLQPDEFIEQLERLRPTLTETAVTEMSTLLLEHFKNESKAILTKERAGRRRFEGRLAKAWDKGFELLELFVALAREAGADFNTEFRPAAAASGDVTFDVLTRLHARACAVAGEVLALLRAGYADGAHARWRLLHEISVVANFVAAQGGDIAERYRLHDAVESYRAAKMHQEHYAALGDEPVDSAELERIRSIVEKLKERFGKAYGTEWGWAAQALDSERPTFRDIERAAGLAHLRPYYKLASHNVHTNPKGVLFKLGLLPEHRVLLAGPSNLGLADPGHGTALSLAQTTAVLLTTRPNLDRIVLCQMLMNLEREVGEAFLAAHRKVDATAARDLATRPASDQPPRE